MSYDVVVAGHEHIELTVGLTQTNLIAGLRHEEGLHQHGFVSLAVVFLSHGLEHLHIGPIAETVLVAQVEGVLDGDIVLRL